MRFGVLGKLATLAFSSVGFAAASSCGHDAVTAPPVTGTNGVIRVLYIGNSLTYTNDLPSMVTALAAASGVTIQSDQVTFPDYALIDHWNEPYAHDKIKTGHFNVVILQQGPSSLPVNADSLRLWTAMWGPEIAAAGARPGLFAVWPDSTRIFAFGDVSNAYLVAAQQVNGLFFPAGDTWLETWARVPGAALYGPDGFHPSLMGTYAAAVVIVATLTGKRATDLAATFTLPATDVDPFNPALASVIRSAASAVIDRYSASQQR